MTKNLTNLQLNIFRLNISISRASVAKNSIRLSARIAKFFVYSLLYSRVVQYITVEP